MKTMTDRFEAIVKDKKIVDMLVQEVRNAVTPIGLKYPETVEELRKVSR